MARAETSQRLAGRVQHQPRIRRAAGMGGAGSEPFQEGVAGAPRQHPQLLCTGTLVSEALGLARAHKGDAGTIPNV